MDIKTALTTNFKSLKDMQQVLNTNKACIHFLEELIWEGVPVSPYDEDAIVYKLNSGYYKCKNTGKKFNVLTGTLFENTKLPLPYWFETIFRLIICRQGIASTTLADELGITQPSAWRMLQKIRNAMFVENNQKLSGVVEVDEYHEGGLYKNMHYDKKQDAKASGPHGNKKLLQGIVERGGNAIIRVVPNLYDETLITYVKKYVAPSSIVYTDDNPSYQKLPPCYTHAAVVHSKGNYVTVTKEGENINTNSIEALWATLSRTITTHIHVSKKFLPLYTNECVFRYNT